MSGEDTILFLNGSSIILVRTNTGYMHTTDVMTVNENGNIIYTRVSAYETRCKISKEYKGNKLNIKGAIYTIGVGYCYAVSNDGNSDLYWYPLYTADGTSAGYVKDVIENDFSAGSYSFRTVLFPDDCTSSQGQIFLGQFIKNDKVMTATIIAQSDVSVLNPGGSEFTGSGRVSFNGTLPSTLVRDNLSNAQLILCHITDQGL